MLRSIFVRWAARLVLPVIVLVCLPLISRPDAVESGNEFEHGAEHPLALAQSERRRRQRQEKTTAPRAPERAPGQPAAKAPDRKAEDPKSPQPPPSPAAIPVPPAEVPVENKDAWPDQEIIAALQACVKEIGPAVAEIEPAPPVRAGQCGAPAPVMVRRVGAPPGVEIRPPAMLNCAMAARLYQWVEAVVQPSAREVLGSPIVTLTNLSGYDCRFRNNAPVGKLSEHAFANALDVGGFVTADKRKLDVRPHWGPTARDIEALAVADAGKTDGKEAARRVETPLDEKAKRNREHAAGQGSDGETQGRTRVRSSGGGRVRARESRSGNGTDVSDADLEIAEAVEEKESVSRRRGKRRGGDRSGKHGQDVRVGRGQDVTRRARAAPDALPVPATRAASTPSPPVTPERTFLTRVHQGACGIFTTVLGPEANEAHRNHFHLDLVARRRRAFCE